MLNDRARIYKGKAKLAKIIQLEIGMEKATDAVIIILLCIATISAIQQTVRVNSRRAQQSRIRAVRRPGNRELRL